MKLLPQDSMVIETGRSPEEVAGLLDAVIEPKQLVRCSSGHKIFEGSLGPDGFCVRRIAGHPNSAVIHGTFSTGKDGVALTVRMGYPAFARAFLGLWFGGLLVMFIGGIVMMVACPGEMSLWTLLGPIALALVGWTIMDYGLRTEAEKVKSILVEVFEVDEAGEQASSFSDGGRATSDEALSGKLNRLAGQRTPNLWEIVTVFRPSKVVIFIVGWNLLCMLGTYLNGGFGEIKTLGGFLGLGLAGAFAAYSGFAPILSRKIRERWCRPDKDFADAKWGLTVIGIAGCVFVLAAVVQSIYLVMGI